jgi:hypothetical protein
MPDACRFCLSEENGLANPLLSPCRCAGTIKFVHRECLTQWRNTTAYDFFKINCQLCHTPYVLPRRWLIEHMPFRDNLWVYVLSQPFFVIIFVHYLHIFILSQFFKKESAIILNDNLSISIFDFLLLNASVVYAAYYTYLIKKVINKQLYFFYNAFDLLRWATGGAICLYLTQFTIFPFGALYLYLISCYYEIHIKALHTININGAL